MTNSLEMIESEELEFARTSNPKNNPWEERLKLLATSWLAKSAEVGALPYSSPTVENYRVGEVGALDRCAMELLGLLMDMETS